MMARWFKANGTYLDVRPLHGETFTLAELRCLVGGDIDIQILPVSRSVLVLNGDGKLNGLPINAVASRLWCANYPLETYTINNDGLIVGDVLICDASLIA